MIEFEFFVLHFNFKEGIIYTVEAVDCFPLYCEKEEILYFKEGKCNKLFTFNYSLN